jgi:CRP-like cAMP-binding protein
MSPEDVFAPVIRKLRSRSVLPDDDAAAIIRLPFVLRTYEAPGYIVREGNFTPRYCSFIRSGFSVRQKLSADGERQIVGLNLPGDFIDLQHLFMRRADHNVQVLRRLDAVDIERDELEALALRRPLVARALWIDTLAEASMHREWILNVGRRDARQRIAHLLCEFAVRINPAAPASKGYELPMTQEQLGDAVGLTSVHVSRSLKILALQDMLCVKRRMIIIKNWENLRQFADFSAFYLHLDQSENNEAR